MNGDGLGRPCRLQRSFHERLDLECRLEWGNGSVDDDRLAIVAFGRQFALIVKKFRLPYVSCDARQRSEKSEHDEPDDDPAGPSPAFGMAILRRKRVGHGIGGCAFHIHHFGRPVPSTADLQITLMGLSGTIDEEGA
jgi:hypothetical protein